MAIGGFVSEMLAEGVIFGWIKRIWNSIFSGVGQEVVGNFVKNGLTPKGLDDENIFAYIFATSQYELVKGKKVLVGTDAKWKMAKKTITKLIEEDSVNGTKYMRNFRMIIALDAIGRGEVTVKVPDPKKPQAAPKLVNKPDPKYVRPGVSILRNMILSCSTEKEFRTYIMLVGAMQNAPFGTLDEMLHWAKAVGLPFLHQALIKTGEVTRDVATVVENHYRELNIEMDTALSMSWFPNPIAKIIALLRAM
ncbi:MAG: hypothetical protein WAV16_02135 [Candidatus Moraniibacteriota bacterium]